MTRLRGAARPGVRERGEGRAACASAGATDGTDGARSGTGGVTGDAGGPFAATGGAGSLYSHSPSRAVAVRPGAAAYRTARLPDFCPASCARLRMSNTAAPPRLPLV